MMYLRPSRLPIKADMLHLCHTSIPVHYMIEMLLSFSCDVPVP